MPRKMDHYKNYRVTEASISAATAYRFRFEPGGWVIFTINDGTGELSVQSDWGNWAHRWSTDPKHLGHPTLTDFIRDRSDCYYLVDKLTTREERQCVDEEATCRDLRQKVVELRRRSGYLDMRKYSFREDRYLDSHVEMTKELARQLWEEADDFARGLCDGKRQAFDVAGELSEEFRALAPEPWEDVRHEEAGAITVLRTVLLPALHAHLRAQPPTMGERFWEAPAAPAEAVTP